MLLFQLVGSDLVNVHWNILGLRGALSEFGLVGDVDVNVGHPASKVDYFHDPVLQDLETFDGFAQFTHVTYKKILSR
jgi:hypothetical protein